MHKFSLILRNLRIKKGSPQKDIAEKLGISTRAYRFYETGDRFPDFHGLITLADYFDVSLDYLVGRSDDPRRH
ncbi:helix-turn-helix transcriptional regulator [Paenibacillus larvae]